MRWPRSLFGRLLGISVLTTLAALLFAGVSIGGVLERFVMRGLDAQLDAQVLILARAIRPDGTLDPVKTVTLPAFADTGSGWSWQVEAQGRMIRSDAADVALAGPAPPRPPEMRHDRHHLDDNGLTPGDGRDGAGRRLHFRQLTVATASGPVVVTAFAPRRVVEAPLRAAMVPLLSALALLGIGLALATFVQLRLGLRPLRTLSVALAEVRAGTRRHVPADQPAELAPLVTELNALVDQNEAGLAHARRHVANLAHGLKTPLAALGVKLAEPGRDPDGSLAVLLGQLDDRVRHHLGRARAAAPGGTGRARTPLAPALDDLVAVLRRVHADRAITPTIAVPVQASVAVDAQDLDEMLGNLLDNGWRHARSAIRIDASDAGPDLRIDIADDGPGLDAQALVEALVPGRRLDEGGDGHGFGLSIAHELAELSGGRLELMRSDALGGLLARLTLPRAAAAADQ